MCRAPNNRRGAAIRGQLGFDPITLKVFGSLGPPAVSPNSATPWLRQPCTAQRRSANQPPSACTPAPVPELTSQSCAQQPASEQLRHSPPVLRLGACHQQYPALVNEIPVLHTAARRSPLPAYTAQCLDRSWWYTAGWQRMRATRCAAGRPLTGPSCGSQGGTLLLTC